MDVCFIYFSFYNILSRLFIGRISYTRASTNQRYVKGELAHSFPPQSQGEDSFLFDLNLTFYGIVLYHNLYDIGVFSEKYLKPPILHTSRQSLYELEYDASIL